MMGKRFGPLWTCNRHEHIQGTVKNRQSIKSIIQWNTVDRFQVAVLYLQLVCPGQTWSATIEDGIVSKRGQVELFSDVGRVYLWIS